MLTIGVAEGPQAADGELGEVLELGIAGAVELGVGHLLFAEEPRAAGEADGERDERDGRRDGREPAQHPDGDVQVHRHADHVAQVRMVAARHSSA